MPAPQYLFGDTAPVIHSIDSAKAINVGDLCRHQAIGGKVLKASDEAWSTDLAGTQTAFAQNFLGVSGQHKPAGATRVFGNSTDGAIRIDTAGVYEFNFNGVGPANIGDYVAPAKASGNALLDDTVALTGNGYGSAIANAIGIVVERAENGATRVKVRILSRVSPQAKTS
jgi:hypothetical protein